MMEGLVDCRIVVGGSRNFFDYEQLEAYLDVCLSAYSDVVIISGHCQGTDLMAERYATEHGLAIEVIPANWKKYGRAAGPIRNREMVERSDVVIAFWDGKSRGTRSLIEYARALKKELRVKMIE